MPETEEEILGLARQADDAKDRAYLLLLLRINSSLEANTAACNEISKEIQTHREEFEEHRKEFQKHVADEAALFNQGRGLWKATAVVLSVAQVVAIGLATWYVNKQDDEARQLREISTAIVKSQAKHDELERVDTTTNTRLLRLERKVFGE